ncbi:Eukaryotic translation initiation factor 2D [Picochlorum sp. SENEW3]|nr:Eukaryotic translation initiation factor 2D [Picochlorum sp. SENEW3]
MFKKAHDVGVSKTHSLGGKDVKKFKNDFLKKYQQLQDEEWSLLFPQKSVTLTKLNNKCYVYSNVDGDPIVFDPSGHGDSLIPTVYALSKIPAMIPFLETNPLVSKNILKGADLFLQGISEASIQSVQARGGFLKDQIWSIKIEGNPIPFAVGKMALSFAQAVENQMAGKGLLALHYFGDHLWHTGSRARPNQGFHDSDIRPIEMDEDVDSAEQAFEAMQVTCPGEHVEEKEEDEHHVHPKLDEIIRSCALGGLKDVKRSELPMTLTSFYTSKMIPLKPEQIVSLDLKNSKYKKIKRLLEELEAEDIVALKTVRKELCVFDIHKDHSTLAEWKAIDLGNDSGSTERKAGISSIQTLYKSPPSFSATIFNVDDRSQLFSPKEVDQALLCYIESHGLAHRDNSEMLVDEFLASYLFGKKEAPSPGQAVPYDDIRQRLYSKLQEWHSIERVDSDGNRNTILRRGKLQPIQLMPLKRKGREITSITGMESFGYNPKYLSDFLQKRMKTACFVTDIPGKNNVNNEQEVVMSGDWINKRQGKFFLPGVFKEDGIPSSYIKIINKLKK